MTRVTSTFRFARKGRSAGAALVGAMAFVFASLHAPLPAAAHQDPGIAVRMVGIEPKLPTGVSLSLVDSDMTFMMIRNSSPTPVDVLDPSGHPFIEVSADGVLVDRASAYLGPTGPIDGTPASVACCPEGNWQRVSDKDGWLWADPRLTPTNLQATQTGGNRGLAKLAGNAPLATWSIPVRVDNRTYTARGDVELRRVGIVRTVIKSVPDGFHVNVIDGHQPQIRINAPRGDNVVIFGQNNEPFIRLGVHGAVGLADSVEYEYHRLAIGMPASHATGWVPMEVTGPDTVTWADFRLDHGDALPTSNDPGVLRTWTIPLTVNGHQASISGDITWTPTAPAPSLDGPAPKANKILAGRGGYIAAGLLTLLLGAAVVLARKKASSPDTSEGQQR